MTEKDSIDKLIDDCKKHYDEKGISFFLFKNFDKKLYFKLYQKGITTADILKGLGLEGEFREFKADNAKWAWPKIIEFVKPIVKENNFLPPAAWFQANKLRHIVAAVYYSGKTWDDLRREFNSYENSSFIISRNGMRWRSHPEASLSNFLYTRGVEHERGKRYPDSYSKLTGQTYGYFDLHFIDKSKRLIDVEIWGEKPNGHDKDHYEYKKNLKEKFNSENENFLAIDFRDCYEEAVLERILEPYIGTISPFIFKNNHDKIIPSTHWSNADELIEYCREFASKMTDGIFPTEEWLRKRGKWKNRKGEAYNTLSIYIKKWIGGVRKLREIIGQSENSTIKWDKDLVLKEYKDIYDRYGITTGQIRGKVRRNELTIDKEEMKTINNIDYAVRKVFGTAYEVNELLNIKNSRRKMK
jgi:hypothetical protein